MSSLEKKETIQRKSNKIPVTPNNLRKLRILKNPKVSQWLLSLKSSVPQSKISLIENHLVNPTQTEREQIAFALNIEEKDLFPTRIENE